jgi:phosphoribosylanthranilate isomerase
MKIKVCGMRDRDNILELTGLKPDYLGMIFYPASARYAGQVEPSIVKGLPDDLIVTGVFVNENETTVLQMIKKYGLKAVQLHGNESADFCSSLRKTLIENNIKAQIIKAFGIDDDFQFDTLEAYSSVVDYFLFDTKTNAFGGSGQRFNWDVLHKYKLDRPYFLSGGIGLNDLSEIKLIKDERLYAVDINSRFETGPALKNMDQVGRAIEIIRENNN